MEISQTCARCGGSNLEAGELMEQGRVVFRTANAGFLKSLVFGNINIKAKMCLDCGDIQLTGDVARAREILKK